MSAVRERLPRGHLALPSIAAGLALALSLPPWGWWPVGLLGAGVLYWRLRGLRLRSRLLAGWLAGLGCYGLGLLWSYSFNWYGAVTLIVVESLFMAVAAALVPPRKGRLLAFVGSFTLLEALRMSWPFGGLPIGGVFLGQAGGPLLGAARLGGPLLLTALVWLTGAALAELVGAFSRRVGSERSGRGYRDDPRRVIEDLRRVRVDPRRVLAAAGALAVVVGFAWGGASAPDGGHPVGSIEVAAIQGGGKRGLSKEEVPPATVFAAQEDATDQLLSAVGAAHVPRPQLVVWPEDVVSLNQPPLVGSAQARSMALFARALDATLVAGVTITLSATAYRNEVVAFAPTGQIVDTFEKVHRVPFGEYVPYRAFFSHLADLSGVPRDAVPGHGSGLMRTPAAPIGVMVSYEVFFADRGRASVRAGARLLVVPTNTSSYATSQIPAQELAAARIQAVQEGRDLVQASPTGYSTVIDNRGTVRFRSVLGRRQVLVARVALRTEATFYERFGDVPVLVLAGLALAAGLATAWIARRRGEDPWRGASPAVHGSTGGRRPERGVTIRGHDRDTGDPVHSKRVADAAGKPPNRLPTARRSGSQP